MRKPLEGEIADILVLGQKSSTWCVAIPEVRNECGAALIFETQAPRLAEEFKGIRLEINFHGPAPISEDTFNLVLCLIKPHVVGHR